MVAVAVTALVLFVYSKVTITYMLVRFIVGGILTEGIIVVSVFLVLGQTKEMKTLKEVIFKK